MLIYHCNHHGLYEICDLPAPIYILRLTFFVPYVPTISWLYIKKEIHRNYLIIYCNQLCIWKTAPQHFCLGARCIINVNMYILIYMCMYVCVCPLEFPASLLVKSICVCFVSLSGRAHWIYFLFCYPWLVCKETQGFQNIILCILYNKC